MTRYVAIVGCGQMGARRAAAVAALPGWSVAAAVDPDLAAAARLAPPDRCYPSWDALNSAVHLDAAIIGVPTAFAAPLTRAALSRGLHVLCEKPPATRPDELAGLDALARERGRVLKYGFDHRHHASVRAAQAVVADGSLGPLRAARGLYAKSSLGAPGSWRVDPARSGGGILLDQGIHLLDLLRLFVGELTTKHALRDGPPGSETGVMGLLEGPHGEPVQLQSSAREWPHRFRLELIFARGALTLDGLLTSSRSYAPETLIVHRPGAEPTRQVFTEDLAVAHDTREFANAVESGAPITAGQYADATAALTLVHAIYAACDRVT
ncbi:MAG: Gfo/Idh/MocA family oxidoreductase [Myxococcales bacterium]|nr:Gfo/Idh/MocA family oxidoreductase [Myxococcales bacterium]